MLASAIARDYGLPPPQYNHANDIIGGPRDPIRYPRAPWLASSHSIPHPLVGSRWLRRAEPAPYVILIRNILQKHEPLRPQGAVLDNPRAFHAWFLAEDRRFFLDTLRHYLRHDFGYDYSF